MEEGVGAFLEMFSSESYFVRKPPHQIRTGENSGEWSAAHGLQPTLVVLCCVNTANCRIPVRLPNSEQWEHKSADFGQSMKMI